MNHELVLLGVYMFLVSLLCVTLLIISRLLYLRTVDRAKMVKQARENLLLQSQCQTYGDLAQIMQERCRKQENSIFFLLGEMGLNIPPGDPFSVPNEEL